MECDKIKMDEEMPNEMTKLEEEKRDWEKQGKRAGVRRLKRVS